MILGIDPGRSQGWAILDETGILRSCGLGDNPPVLPSLVVLEKPQIYPDTPTKQANDLVTLAVSVGRMAERFSKSKILLVTPHTWKGSTPKPIHNRRVLAKLSLLENGIYLRDTLKIAESYKNNVIDAIGLAKYGFLRM